MAESEKIFSKYLLPVHQKFASTTFFKQFPCLTLEAKIKIYTMKVMKNLENAKLLCKTEETNNRNGEKFKDELALKSIDLDYDTIHSEILENIIFDENDSGLSDFDTNEEEESKKKIFEITKIKTIIHNSVKTLFDQCQEDEQYKPLIQQEIKIEEDNKKDIIKEKIIENINSGLISNNENKTQENTDDFTEDSKEKEKENSNNNKNITEDSSTDVIIKEEKKIVNYKKYDIYTDPFSNYNNFTKKFKVNNKVKKRFRDIYPFLKTFNPKFLKKENIDKKIFRRFRKFIKFLYKENSKSPIFSKNPFFWKKFYIKNLLPPVKVVVDNGELIEHKSFNTQYLIWLFAQEGTTELFKLFTQKELDNVINNFVSEYHLNKYKEPNIIEKLKQYITFIPEIYDSYNTGEKKVILEETKEIFDTNECSGKKEDDITNLESYDSEIQENNPFNLNFELIDNKNFMEFPYDNNNYYYNRKNNYTDYLKVSDYLKKKVENELNDSFNEKMIENHEK